MDNKLISVGLKIFLITVAFLSCGNRKTENNPDSSKKLSYGELNPYAPKETKQFGQFVGKWEVTSLDSIPNKGWHESKATWIYKYALDGFSIEDIWYEQFKDNTNNTQKIGRDFTGKNIRIYNPNTKQWNITWLENGGNSMVGIITAKANQNGNIIMQMPNKSAEITFYNITNTSFHWKSEILVGDKKFINSKMIASRLE